jgi:hypothetical protein
MALFIAADELLPPVVWFELPQKVVFTVTAGPS